MKKIINILIFNILCVIIGAYAQPLRQQQNTLPINELLRSKISQLFKGSTTAHNLPLIIIETGGLQIPNDPKITARMKIIDNGVGKLNYFDNTGNVYDGYIGIEIHGQSSQMFPKKSYGIELRDANGVEQNVSLLGLPAENDFILYAPYSDKTLIRNALTYYLGRRFEGGWQPRYKFCEAYLNGSYIGIYQLTEKIKRDANRVNINKLNPDEISGDNVTGGYIFKVDKIQDLPVTDYFYSVPTLSFMNARNYAFTYVYPQPEDIVLQQKNYLAAELISFQNALNGNLFKDPIVGYPKYLNVNSFVDFEIINELSNNVDGYRYSTFFYKQKDSDGGKIFAGPIWDFDLCYGNVDYSPRNLSTSEWVYPNFGPNEGYCMHWWYQLMQDPTYVTLLKNRWTQLRQGPLHLDSINTFIDNTISNLGSAISRNFVQWPILGVKVWPNYFVGTTHQSEVNYLKGWISDRLRWMDTQWLLQSGINDSNLANAFTVFPNPFSTEFTVKFYLTDTGTANVALFNMAGLGVHQEIFRDLSIGYQELHITTSELKSGLYLLRINLPGDQVIVKKIFCK